MCLRGPRYLPSHQVEGMKGGRMELRRVKPEELDLSLGYLRQIPEGAVREKVASLERQGQFSPLVASEEAGILVLVDGFVRHLAAVRGLREGVRFRDPAHRPG